MIDRTWTSVLGGLLALTGACKDEAPASSSSEVKASEAEGANAKRTDAKAVEPAKAAAPPAAAPPSGYAVARVGSLLFFSSTGDVGFELPPVGSAAGMTVNVVGEQDGRLVVETLVTEPAEHHCAATLDGLADFRLRLYLARTELLPVLTEELEHSFGDGTKLRLARGVPVPAGSTELDVRGTKIRVPVPAERLGRYYPPGSPFSKHDDVGEVLPYPGHGLTYDGRTLDEASFYARGGNVLRFGVVERASDALVTVRNPCLEVTALVSLERLRSITPIPGTLAGYMDEPRSSPYEDALAAATLAGPGATTKVHAVKSGTPISWADGRPAGQVTADHAFETPPRAEGGRSCFDAPLALGQATTVTLCFAPGDVDELVVPTMAAELAAGGLLGSLDPEATGGLGLGEPLGMIGGVPGGSGIGSGSGIGHGSGRKTPKVKPSKATVTGSLDKDIIRRIVRAHINEVRYCYNQGLARDPSLSGKVSIRFTVSTTGSVAVSEVADSTIADEGVSNCIAKAVRRWTFPKPTGGGVVVVTYPFVLETAE